MSTERTKRNNTEIESALFIQGGHDDDWYIGSSLNDNLCAEGAWEKWVVLARQILNEDQRRKKPGYRVQQVIF